MYYFVSILSEIEDIFFIELSLSFFLLKVKFRSISKSHKNPL